MDKNEEKTIMTDAEFEENLAKAIDYFANIAIHGGLWEIPEYVLNVEEELFRRGMQPLNFQKDSRVADRVEQIKQEKAQARENDPEGYEAARRRYTELLQKQLEKEYKQELGEIDSSETEEPNSVVKELGVATEALYKYEHRQRSWWNELHILKGQVTNRKQEIIDELPDEEKMALEIQKEIDTLMRVKNMDDILSFEATWHQGDIEHDGYMSNMYASSAAKNAEKIRDLQKKQSELPTVSMSDILRRAISDVKVSMDDFKKAKKSQSPEVEITREGENK